MTALLDLLTLLVFVGVILMVVTWRSLKGKKRQDEAIQARLDLLKQHWAPAGVSSTDAVGILRDLDTLPVSHWPWIGPMMTRLWLNLGLIGWQAGLRQRLMILGLISVLAGAGLGHQTPWPWMASLGLILTIWWGLFQLLYRHALNQYLSALKAALPEAIDAITRAARAGVPATNAFAMVAQNIPGALAREFTLIDSWMQLGMPLKQAIQDSARRVPLPEYRFFAVIIIINQEAGGRLGETLERLSATLRERAELALKVQSKTSEARASSKIVASLVPLALAYMYFSSPQDFHFLLSDPTGNKVLFYAFGSVLLGLLITQRMVRRVS